MSRGNSYDSDILRKMHKNAQLKKSFKTFERDG